MNTGQNLYKRAKEIIPGGNQLLSKRPEMFLPEKWPAYYKKAKGIEVWDLDDNKYFDMTIMAIGTSSLGYANPAVSKAVKKAINNGCVSSLNSYEEVDNIEMWSYNPKNEFTVTLIVTISNSKVVKWQFTEN